MVKTIKISLGEQEFLVPRLTLGQQEDLIELWDEVQPEGMPLGRFFMRRGKKTAEIVLRRAQPAIGSIDEIECTAEELNAAAYQIFAFSGLQTKAPETGEAQPKGEV